MKISTTAISVASTTCLYRQSRQSQRTTESVCIVAAQGDLDIVTLEYSGVTSQPPLAWLWRTSAGTDALSEGWKPSRSSTLVFDRHTSRLANCVIGVPVSEGNRATPIRKEPKSLARATDHSSKEPHAS